jgi:hypothetical protein
VHAEFVKVIAIADRDACVGDAGGEEDSVAVPCAHEVVAATNASAAMTPNLGDLSVATIMRRSPFTAALYKSKSTCRSRWMLNGSGRGVTKSGSP